MATTRSAKIKDPTGAGGGQVNVMDSGLTHCADSIGSGREGTIKLRFGSPGDPLEKSKGVKAGYMGRAPKIFAKFTGERQK